MQNDASESAFGYTIFFSRVKTFFFSSFSNRGVSVRRGKATPGLNRGERWCAIRRRRYLFRLLRVPGKSICRVLRIAVTRREKFLSHPPPPPFYLQLTRHALFHRSELQNSGWLFLGGHIFYFFLICTPIWGGCFTQR